MLRESPLVTPPPTQPQKIAPPNPPWSPQKGVSRQQLLDCTTECLFCVKCSPGRTWRQDGSHVSRLVESRVESGTRRRVMNMSHGWCIW